MNISVFRCGKIGICSKLQAPLTCEVSEAASSDACNAGRLRHLRPPSKAATAPRPDITHGEYIVIQVKSIAFYAAIVVTCSRVP